MKIFSLKSTGASLLVGMALVTGMASNAQALFGRLFSKHNSSSAETGKTIEGEVTENYRDRAMYIHVPTQLPPQGSRALVVVLHGGMGNAERIASQRSEKGMNLDAVADKYGFVVAYMNGTPVTKHLGNDKKGWNAGECCGQSSEKNIDDVSYISEAVRHLEDEYGIDSRRIYGMGHSNGAMMTQRIICEVGLYASGISISGTLEIEKTNCPGAQGRSILELHGAKDTAVPLEGGKGEGISNKYDKRSQKYAKRIFTNSGAQYTLQVLQAEHKLDTIEKAIEQSEGTSLPEKAARFFGLSGDNR